MHLEEKFRRLAAILLECKQLAIAFSGGIDSGLLLKCALDVLGAGNVLVLFARSELLRSDEIERAENWPAANALAPPSMSWTRSRSPRTAHWPGSTMSS